MQAMDGDAAPSPASHEPAAAQPAAAPAAPSAARTSPTAAGRGRALPVGPTLASVALVLFTVQLRILLVPTLGGDTPYLLLIPALVAVALVWGARPALAGAAAGLLVTELWLLTRVGGQVATSAWVLRGAIVLATAALVGVVAGRLREAEARAVARATDAVATRWEAEHAAVVAEANETRYRSLFRSMGEGFALHELVFDENGDPCDYRFLEVNPAFERLTGLRSEHVVGRLHRELLPDNDPHWLRIYADVALTGRPVYFESRSSALERDYEVYATCPAPNQFTTLFRDVTVRRQMERALRESEQHHRLLFETMTQGVVYQGADGRILAMNAAAERILGRAPEDFVGHTSADEQHLTVREDGSPFPAEEHPAMVALRVGRPLSGVLMGVRNPRDGELHWIEVSAVPLFRDGEERPYQVYTLFADVTERKRSEDALRRSEQRHRELAAELREADQRKSDFLAVLSHELRNPLAPVRNSLYVLERVAPGSDQARHAQKVITRQVAHLAQIVDDLLDMTRISRGKVQLRLETVDLGDVLRRTVEDHRMVFEQAARRPAHGAAFLSGLGLRRPDPHGADRRQPARQRGQVHAGRGRGHARARQLAGRGHDPRQRHRRRHRARGAEAPVRAVRPGAADPRAQPGWPGAGPGAGEGVCRDAGRQRSRRQRGSRPRFGLHAEAAARRGSLGLGEERPRNRAAARTVCS